MGRRRGIGMALVKIHIPNRRHLRLLCELQKQLASPVRSKKIDAKFKAAQTKAKRAGVDALSQADIEAARASSNKSVDIKRRPS